MGSSGLLGLSSVGRLLLFLPLKIRNDLDEKLTEAATVKCLSLESELNRHIGLTFLVRLAHTVEERMREGFIDADAEVWVELEHTIQQIATVTGGTWVFLSQVHARDVCETLQVAMSLRVRHV